MNIGENIRQMRVSKNISQKELGEKLGGISQQQIGRWENGKAKKKKETIEKIANALGVDPYSLYSFEMATEELEKESHAMVITEGEISHIKKYRTLDQHGKKVVDFLLEEEYSRQLKEPVPEYLILNAAHAIGGASPEDIQHDGDIMNDEDF